MSIRRIGGPAIAVLLTVVLSGSVAGCSADHAQQTSAAGGSGSSVSGGSGADAHPAVPRGHATMPTEAEMKTAWSSRPAYVDGGQPEVRGAYAYALARPDVLQWLPCYCGCGGMGHRSNLDCFYKPRQAGLPIAFEEHASFCDVCVKTALMAQRMIGEGKSMVEIRDAVDSTFGNLAPGTDTERPPA